MTYWTWANVERKDGKRWGKIKWNWSSYCGCWNSRKSRPIFLKHRSTKEDHNLIRSLLIRTSQVLQTNWGFCPQDRAKSKWRWCCQKVWFLVFNLIFIKLKQKIEFKLNFKGINTNIWFRRINFGSTNRHFSSFPFLLLNCCTTPVKSCKFLYRGYSCRSASTVGYWPIAPEDLGLR